MCLTAYPCSNTPPACSLLLQSNLDTTLPLPTYEILKLRYDSGNIQWVCHIQDMPYPTDSRIEHTIEIHQIDCRSNKHKQGLDLVLTLVCWWLNTHGQLDVKANEKNPSNGFCEFINWLLHDGLAEPNSIQKMLYRLSIKSDIACWKSIKDIPNVINMQVTHTLLGRLHALGSIDQKFKDRARTVKAVTQK